MSNPTIEVKKGVTVRIEGPSGQLTTNTDLVISGDLIVPDGITAMSNERYSELLSKEAKLDAWEKQSPIGYVNPAVINSLNSNWSSCTTITTHIAFETDVPLFTKPKEVT